MKYISIGKHATSLLPVRKKKKKKETQGRNIMMFVSKQLSCFTQLYVEMPKRI